MEAQIRPIRSGLAIKHGITMLNSPGTIDSDYRGEIKVDRDQSCGSVGGFQRSRSGERIAQLVVAAGGCGSAWEQVENLDATGRAEGGFGSTQRSLTGRWFGDLWK